ncbi:hypothetical protein AOLI_G00261620 [Acnodon oligacanthus]
MKDDPDSVKLRAFTHAAPARFSSAPAIRARLPGSGAAELKRLSGSELPGGERAPAAQLGFRTASQTFAQELRSSAGSEPQPTERVKDAMGTCGVQQQRDRSSTAGIGDPGDLLIPVKSLQSFSARAGTSLRSKCGVFIF